MDHFIVYFLMDLYYAYNYKAEWKKKENKKDCFPIIIEGIMTTLSFLLKGF